MPGMSAHFHPQEASSVGRPRAEGCCKRSNGALQPYEPSTRLRVAGPAHGGVVDAVDVAVGGGPVEAVGHALHVVVPVQVIEWVLQQGKWYQNQAECAAEDGEDTSNGICREGGALV